MTTVIAQLVATGTAEVTRAPQNAHLDENNNPIPGSEPAIKEEQE